MKKTLSFLTTGMLAASMLSAAPLALAAGSASTSVNAHSTTTFSTDENFLNTFINGGDLTDESADVFDVQAFRNHPCYNAVGGEVDFCLSTLGVASDFQSMIAGNEFNRLFLEYSLASRCSGLSGDERTDCEEENQLALPRLLGQLDNHGTGSVLSDDDEDITDDTENESDSPTLTRYQRSQRLWDLCAASDRPQAFCYQDFIRFVTDENITIAEMDEVVGGPGYDRGNDNDDDSTRESARFRTTGEGDDADATKETDDVQSETDEDIGSMNNQERAEWLWDLCADSGEGQSMCYRHHFRTAIDTDTDLQTLQSDIQG